MRIIFTIISFLISFYVIQNTINHKEHQRQYNNHVTKRPTRPQYKYLPIEYITESKEELKEQLRIKIQEQIKRSTTDKLNEIFDKEICLRRFQEKYNLIDTSIKTQTVSDLNDYRASHEYVIPSLITHVSRSA